LLNPSKLFPRSVAPLASPKRGLFDPQDAEREISAISSAGKRQLFEKVQFRFAICISTPWKSIPTRKIGEFIMLGTVLLVLLVLMLVGALPAWGHSRSWGYGPSGGLGLLVVVLLILVLLRVI